MHLTLIVRRTGHASLCLHRSDSNLRLCKPWFLMRPWPAAEAAAVATGAAPFMRDVTTAEVVPTSPARLQDTPSRGQRPVEASTAERLTAQQRLELLVPTATTTMAAIAMPMAIAFVPINIRIDACSECVGVVIRPCHRPCAPTWWDGKRVTSMTTDQAIAKGPRVLFLSAARWTKPMEGSLLVVSRPSDSPT